MDWISWAIALAAGVASGAAGAYLYSHRSALLRVAAPYWLRLRQRLSPLLRAHRTRPAPAPARQAHPPEDVVVLIPDGRPWPLGPALQLLEIAWRWQVVHGANLPLRARQGEGAYVWRPPLPARSHEEQHTAGAERS